MTRNIWQDDDYVYASAVMDYEYPGWPAEPYHETCYIELIPPGAQSGILVGSDNLNYNSCSTYTSFTGNLEAGTYTAKFDMYDWMDGSYPVNPFYYFRFTEASDALSTLIEPWFKLTPGGWSDTTIDRTGSSSLRANVITSKNCTGSVSLNMAYVYPANLATDEIPPSTVSASVQQQSINIITIGRLVLQANNTVIGTVYSSVQVGTRPSSCTLRKDESFEANLQITSN